MVSPSENDWKRFSRAYREYESNRYGYCTCFTCGSHKHWKEMDLGHYIDRRWASIKYFFPNLEIQCQKCNRYEDGNLDSYSRQLITKYHGDWIIPFLEESKLTFRPLYKDEVKWLISHLRAGIKSKLLF